MKTCLEHVRANVRSLELSRDWYARVLKLEAGNYWPPDDPIYLDFASRDGAVFSIVETDERPVGTRFNFTVDDVEALWEDLKDQVEVIEPVFTTAYGTRKFTILDPDGNELGFIQKR